MPGKNVIKTYVEDGMYHIYNRGVEKRTIFTQPLDYNVFLRNLKESLNAPRNPKELLKNVTVQGVTFKGIPKQSKNFFGKIDLLAYCLMPNHFHLLIKQTDSYLIQQLMQSITTRYSMYFNRQHKRIGALFQNTYKAVLVTEEPYMLHITRYIHKNSPKFLHDMTSTYSSYPEYLGKRKTSWVHPEHILSFFKPGALPAIHHTSYKEFVEAEDVDSAEYLGDMILDTL